jgi:hypothetical protein
VPERPDANAICVPVGDHVGVESISGLFVSRRRIRTVPVHDIDLRIAVAIRRERNPGPVGENTGSQFWPAPLVGVSIVPA